MSNTMPREAGKVKITKHGRNSDNLEITSAAIAALAEEIWREHYTPIIGAGQVEYMLGRFQSAKRVYEDIKNDGYTYFTVECLEYDGDCGGMSGGSGEGPRRDKLVGYSACAPGEGYLFLSKLYIHKDYRGKGLSRKLLDEAITLCEREYELSRIRLTVNKYNEHSIAVYKKMGFEVIEEVKNDIGGGFYMDDFVMEKGGNG